MADQSSPPPAPSSAATTAMPSQSLTAAPTSSPRATPSTRDRATSSVSSRLRSASQSASQMLTGIMETSPPLGMWSATGQLVGAAPTIGDIRDGSFTTTGWDGEGQRRNSTNLARERSGSASTRARRTSAAKGSLPASPTGVPVPGQQESGILEERLEDESTSNRMESDFPDIVLGRGEMTSQSYDPSKSSRRVSKMLVPQPVIIDDEEEEDDLQDLDPRPKRRSKDVRAMLGDSPIEASAEQMGEKPTGPDEDGYYPNGYHFPAKKSWGQATLIGLKAFWKFFTTPLGFVVVIYGLNVVGWGAMLFFLLLNAAPEMCWVDGIHDCNNINSPRRIWIEIDSQILNSLFCVTGFGLIPWRFRDWYYLLKWRITKQQDALRRLAGFHRGWFRLPGSDELPLPPPGSSLSPETLQGENVAALPLPLTKAPNPPLTGVRAPATVPWKLDYVIWAFVANTFLQAVLSAFMWGFSRYTRPSWSTGLFVALGCIVAALGGLMQFLEGKRIKKIEGIPVEAAAVLGDVESSVVKNGVKGEQTVA